MANPGCGRRKGAKGRLPSLLRLAGERSRAPSSLPSPTPIERAGRLIQGKPRRKELRRLRPGSSEAVAAVQPASQPRSPESSSAPTAGDAKQRRESQGSRRRGQKRLPGRVSQELSRRSSGERQSEEGRPSSAPRPPLPFPALGQETPGSEGADAARSSPRWKGRQGGGRPERRLFLGDATKGRVAAGKDRLMGNQED